ncbi:hypothetical protein BRADI_2g41495v3 [Brachypodium distachyon]|uniref:Uncharacterized protein n=1 Tax=Brachypodium distachyon TaxID=15368 RepID=A0A2K2DD64_BRADI|nr:hypothetical protein BRADI_2g41495v3 [Brachypodium distachyon]
MAAFRFIWVHVLVPLLDDGDGPRNRLLLLHFHATSDDPATSRICVATSGAKDDVYWRSNRRAFASPDQLTKLWPTCHAT